ncbi:class I adenylate-forming enzyme family protein [Lutibaculum baratangense]|uniref:Long-chain-fatty-acid--CoA ligase n=1 Tax=Lutibaculum baratangense AMV1 TaxID=631454 RepID=V4QVK8_9HYPH|nr:class I adenylate-forming enzyme family protein [Lutibaculum baratangense]ESR23797.1 Long-chain-fatty-acid--CoA ligase [Lutibaculum baratangense AMV1]
MRPFLTLHHPESARRFYEAGVWRDETLYDLLVSHAEARPDAPALTSGDGTLSWSELRAWVDGIAADLRIYGLEGGDRVSVWMSNRMEVVAMLLACSREGFACNPSLHRTYTCGDIGTLLSRLSARALLTEPGWGADRADSDLDRVLAGISSLKVVYTPDTFPKAAPNATPPVGDPDKVVYLAFTSGTTGAPKCVMHSDNSLLANARDLVADWAHGHDTVLLTLSPLSHHIAWVAVAQWLVAGCRLVLDAPPAGMSRLDWIIESGATYVMGVPTHAMDVLAEQRQRGIARMGSVSVFYMAGSPIPPTTAEAFVGQGIKPQNIYGMTENSSHQYTHPDDPTDIVTTTCGRGGKAYEVRLFAPEDADREVATGEVGHITGRGGALMLGYFDAQGPTEQSFNRDGWFLSGDLGVVDEGGNLKIVGRLKDLIIRGGHNIYPANIEALALRHAAVDRVACFAVPDERLGERVCIAVVGTVLPDEVLDHLAAEGLSKFDMPEFFLRMESFPLTPSGKILKRELGEMLKRGELAPVPVRYVAKPRMDA